MVGAKKELDTVFEDFIEKLVLTNTQRQRIDSVVCRAQDIFSDKASIKLQGSFATGTTVKPLTEENSNDKKAGEYDADIALLSSKWSMPIDVLNDILSCLIENYGDKTDTNKRRNSCERVIFTDEGTGVGFHTDYVPIKTEQDDITKCTDREKNKWKFSPTFKLINSYNKFDTSHPYASSCVLILKRLRDFTGLSEYIPSIIILTLVYEYYIDTGSYFSDLDSLCDHFIEVIQSNKTILFMDQNGCVLTENLNEKIKQRGAVLDILNKFKSSLEKLTIDSLGILQEYLSSDFPVDVNDYPTQMQSLRSEGFSYDTKFGLENISIDTFEHNNSSFRKYTNAMRFSQVVGMKLKAKNHRELNIERKLQARWRITNDPTRVPVDKIRGELLPREKENEFIRKETAQYDGLHRAELFVFDKGSKKIIGKGKYKVKKVQHL